MVLVVLVRLVVLGRLVPDGANTPSPAGVAFALTRGYVRRVGVRSYTRTVSRTSLFVFFVIRVIATVTFTYTIPPHIRTSAIIIAVIFTFCRTIGIYITNLFIGGTTIFASWGCGGPGPRGIFLIV